MNIFSGTIHNTRSNLLLSITLIAIVLAVYMQVEHHQFLSFDDDVYVTRNPHVTSGITGNNIIWAFTSFHAANWHPITWLSHMLDVQLYGVNPRGHHFTNVIIHTLSSLLLLQFLLRTTASFWKSSFVAALFALHPIHVESVAWVAERKDVLCALFWFITLLCYSEYAKKQKPALYVLSLISFVLGLMTKPMLVTLPVVLLLLDYWPLDRYRHEDQEQKLQKQGLGAIVLIKEKIPFLACSLLSSVVTVYAQHKGGAMDGMKDLSFLDHLENALISYVRYIGKTFWPHDLSVFYPFPSFFPLWQVISSLFVLLILSATAIKLRRQYPYFFVGWFFFLVTLLPVIGLIQVGIQSMADRYTYIPVIGLFITVAWGVPNLTKGIKNQEAILALFGSLIITASVILTYRQIAYWQDDIVLYRHALNVTTGSYLMHNSYGFALEREGEIDSAIQEYQKAIRLNPVYAKAHNNLGAALVAKGSLDAAIKEYQMALLISPNFAKAHYNLGVAFANKGDLTSAIFEYHEAIRIDPNDSDPHVNLGIAIARKGDLAVAIQEFSEALRINPNDADALNNLGFAFANKGDLDSAIQEFQRALQVNPNNEFARNNLERVILLKSTHGKVIQ